MERITRPSDAALQQAYEILAEDAETAEVERLMAVQAETQLPLAECAHEAEADDEMTPERVADVLLEEEAAWHRGPLGNPAMMPPLPTTDLIRIAKDYLRAIEKGASFEEM